MNLDQLCLTAQDAERAAIIAFISRKCTDLSGGYYEVATEIREAIRRNEHRTYIQQEMAAQDTFVDGGPQS